MTDTLMEKNREAAAGNGLLQTVGCSGVFVAFTHTFFELIEALSERSHGAGQAVAEQQQGNNKDDAQFNGAGSPCESVAVEEQGSDVLHKCFSVGREAQERMSFVGF